MKCSHIKNDVERGLVQQQLWHDCMAIVTEPLIEAGTHGVEILCGDGNVRDVFPIVLSYSADFPEQCLIGCNKQSHCPMCNADEKNRGDLPSDGDERRFRVTAEIVRALDDQMDGMRHKSRTYDEFGLKAIQPFFVNLPHIDLDTLFTPDLLHQLHSGCFKDHLLQWFKTIMGRSEFDARFQKVSPFPGLRHFKKAISTLSQSTGKEMKELEKIFTVVIKGAPKVSPEARKAAVALLHFIYLAQLPCQSDRSIKALQTALQQFHKYKHVFVDSAGKICKGFHGIPKFHSLEHYARLILSKGSPDGFSTEAPERLHIEFAKKAFRATNKHEFIVQMIRWLQRQSSLDLARSYLEWCISRSSDDIHG